MTEQWIVEQLHPYYRKSLKVLEYLVDEQTDFQHLQIARTEFFGKVMVLDGIIQLTEKDNMGYHEMITHIPMLAHANPQRVLIVGGGDGGSLQQVLRYPNVEEVVVCELDRRVIETSREHLTFFGDPYSDPRVQIVIQDAFIFLAGKQGYFDVIISDTTDPIGEAEKLFSETFYRMMVTALRSGGTIATQCEQMFFDAALIKDILQMAGGLVKNPAYYYAMVPTYPGGGIGFMYVSDEPWTNGLNKPYPPGKMNYLNPDIHKAAFSLPEFFKQTLA